MSVDNILYADEEVRNRFKPKRKSDMLWGYIFLTPFSIFPLFLSILLWLELSIRRTTYVETDQRIIKRRNILKERYTIVRKDKIKYVEKSQRLLGRYFDTAEAKIHTAGTSSRFEPDMKLRAVKLKDLENLNEEKDIDQQSPIEETEETKTKNILSVYRPKWKSQDISLSIISLIIAPLSFWGLIHTTGYLRYILFFTGLTALGIIFMWIIDPIFRKYELTEDAVVEKFSFLTNKNNVVKYSDISYTSLNQGLLGKKFNTGQILVNTPGTSGVEMIIKNVKNPVEIKKQIDSRKQDGI